MPTARSFAAAWASNSSRCANTSARPPRSTTRRAISVKTIVLPVPVGRQKESGPVAGDVPGPNRVHRLALVGPEPPAEMRSS